MRKMMKRVKESAMKHMFKASYILKDTRGEGYIDTAVIS